MEKEKKAKVFMQTFRRQRMFLSLHSIFYLIQWQTYSSLSDVQRREYYSTTSHKMKLYSIWE